MYNPPVFREASPEVLREAMAAHPLAVLVTMGPQRVEATHLPLLYDPSPAPWGVLRGHMARVNPQWRQYVSGSEALAIFSGPEHYISPNWYATKVETGKSVPTWNYVTVQARGPLTFTNDRAWLLENVTALTNTHEKALAELSDTQPWRVEDAPSDYVENMLGAIVGVELAITSIEGKWKVSQNRERKDREGAIAGLRGLRTPEAVRMAKLIEEALPE